MAALKPAIAVDCNSVAGRWHGDPADRIIAATARSEGLSLVTCDRQVLDCVAQGYVGALPRSDA